MSERQQIRELDDCTICGVSGVPKSAVPGVADDTSGYCTKCDAKRCFMCLRWFKNEKFMLDHQNHIHNPLRLAHLNMPGFCPGCRQHSNTSEETCPKCDYVFRITRKLDGKEDRVFTVGDEVKFRRLAGGIEDRGIIVHIRDEEVVVVCYVDKQFQSPTYDEEHPIAELRAWCELFDEKRSRRSVVKDISPKDGKPDGLARKGTTATGKATSTPAATAKVKAEVAKLGKNQEKKVAARRVSSAAVAASRVSPPAVAARTLSSASESISDSESESDSEDDILTAHGLAMKRPACLASMSSSSSAQPTKPSSVAASGKSSSGENAGAAGTKRKREAVAGKHSLTAADTANPDPWSVDVLMTTCDAVLQELEGLFRPTAASLTRYCFGPKGAFLGLDPTTVLARADYYLLRALVYDIYHWIQSDRHVRECIDGFSVSTLLEILVFFPQGLLDLCMLPCAGVLRDSVQEGLVDVLNAGLQRRGARVPASMPTVEELMASESSGMPTASLHPAVLETRPTARFSMRFQMLTTPSARGRHGFAGRELTIEHLKEMDLSLPLSFEIFDALNRIMEERSDGMKKFEGTGNLAEWFNGRKSMYGRVFPPLVQTVVERTRIGASDRFLDIGSGIAQTCVQVAATVACVECVGVEHNTKYHNGALELLKTFDLLLEEVWQLTDVL